jgi:hypothetical protein
LWVEGAGVHACMRAVISPISNSTLTISTRSPKPTRLF